MGIVSAERGGETIGWDKSKYGSGFQLDITCRACNYGGLFLIFYLKFMGRFFQNTIAQYQDNNL